MRIKAILWPQDRVDHIWERHRVTPEEAEEALDDPDGFLVRVGRSIKNPEERTYFWLGRTESGRYLTLVLIDKGKGRFLLLTARDQHPEKEVRRYNARRD